MHQAMDTFTGTLDDGITPFHVQKGAYLPDSHELVKRDQDPDKGSGNLFKRVFIEDDEAPKAKRGPGRPRKSTLAAVPSGDADEDGDE